MRHAQAKNKNPSSTSTRPCFRNRMKVRQAAVMIAVPKRVPTIACTILVDIHLRNQMVTLLTLKAGWGIRSAIVLYWSKSLKIDLVLLKVPSGKKEAGENTHPQWVIIREANAEKTWTWIKRPPNGKKDSCLMSTPIVHLVSLSSFLQLREIISVY